MKYLTPLVLAAGLAFSAGSATAMTDEEVISMGQSMLTGALYNSLRAQGYDASGIEKLTLSEIALLSNLLSTDSSAAVRDGQVNLIFERARAR